MDSWHVNHEELIPPRKTNFGGLSFLEMHIGLRVFLCCVYRRASYIFCTRNSEQDNPCMPTIYALKLPTAVRKDESQQPKNNEEGKLGKRRSTDQENCGNTSAFLPPV